ncbi:MAG: helix-turn-helix domain-containing protein [Dehalococcoidales bacterium]|nr:helix-turn-helix domain-containing protein [Dehalococcoidales bacterium]
MSSHVLLVEPEDLRRRLAGVLLQYAGTEKASRPRLSQREMAMMLGTSREMVNGCLESFQAEGAIRFERHRMIINKKALEGTAMDIMKAKAYALLRVKNTDLEQAAAIVERQPGVMMIDQLEGFADLIFAVQAPDRESLARLMEQAIATVEDFTEEVELLPARTR